MRSGSDARLDRRIDGNPALMREREEALRQLCVLGLDRRVDLGRGAGRREALL
ncbi:hypothetical protein [Methylocystis bryophila]|uniref:hypothetical protein n=1 Tax=Methylocystis bryophila TaxID=655015 RepID=UPI00131A2A5C|nr:hypothetical protein [Methylocystis bryophila]